MPPASADPSSNPAQDIWKDRLARARHSLASYRESTRYPPGSRPLAEHPDQGTPHHVGALTLPLARKDGKLTTAKVTLGQDRLFLVGDERATLSVACSDGDGPAPCELASAVAMVPPDASSPGSTVDAGTWPPVPVPFTPAGATLTAVFQPSQSGFAGYRGPLRIELALAVAGESGTASFDLAYSPAAPAVFTGQVGDVLAGGSLTLNVELQVDEPGRYVIAGRADDADGHSFAYLSENVLLAAGRQTVALQLFGKLVLAASATSPFRLRDLEGFRLLENVYPDRDLMPALEGVVYTTKGYALRDFSDADWESEEKTRNVNELTRDVDTAQAHVGGG